MQQVTNHHDNAPRRNQPQHKRRSSTNKKTQVKGVRRKERRKEDIKMIKVEILKNMLGVEEI